MILNTLQKFKNEDQARSESSQARQRKEVEKKIEVKEQEEKTKITEEKNELLREKRRQEDRIRIIEKKLQITEDYQEWEKRQLCLKNFVKTKTRPFIYYKPRIIDETNEKLIKETANGIDEEIKKRKIEIEKEIETLEIKENELNSIQFDDQNNINKNKHDLNETIINKDGEEDGEVDLKNEPETALLEEGDDEEVVNENKQSSEDLKEDVQKNVDDDDDDDELDEAVMVSEPGLLAE
jgi:pinin